MSRISIHVATVACVVHTLLSLGVGAGSILAFRVPIVNEFGTRSQALICERFRAGELHCASRTLRKVHLRGFVPPGTSPGKKHRKSDVGALRCKDMSLDDGDDDGALEGGSDGQERMPFVAALTDAADKVRVPFFFPGHQMGRSAPLAWIRDALPLDLPEDVEEIDCLSYADGPILESQQLAARLFGARHSFFLCNGSTGGILAALLAAVQLHQRSKNLPTGESVVILPRNAHKSAVQGLVLSGAKAVWLPPLYDSHFGISFGFHLSALQAALEEHQERVAAVMCVSPTYHGVLQNISAVKAAITASAAVGAPLIVDEAHGSHLSLISDLQNEVHFGQHSGVGAGGRKCQEMGALSGGADVVVQSTHKTLTSLTQSSMLHLV